MTPNNLTLDPTAPDAPPPPPPEDYSRWDARILQALRRAKEAQKVAKDAKADADPGQLALLVQLQAIEFALLEVATAIHMSAGRFTGQFMLNALVPPEQRS